MNSAKSNTNLFVYLILIIFLYSCEKKNEIDIPTVLFLKPYENQHYVVGDTVPIIFDVTSISNITAIQITLVNEALTPVSENYQLNQLLGKTIGRVKFELIIDDLFMLSGNYFIKVLVKNKRETKYKYQKVSISNLDRKLLGVALISKQPNLINVWNYDLNYQKTLVKTMIGDYGGSKYLPFHNRMALSGKIKGSYTIWNYITGDTVYHQNALPNPPFPYFTGAASIDHYLVCQYYAGGFDLIDYKGNISNSINTTQDFYPVDIFDIGKNFISIEYHIGSTEKRLVAHVGSTGMNYSYNILKGPVVKAFPFSENYFMMFSNYYGTGQIRKYYWNAGPTKPISYSGDEFIDVAQIGVKDYLLLTANNVLWYQYEKSSITSMINISNLDVIKVLYESVSQTIWIVDKQGFSIYSYPSGNLISDHRVNEEVLNLHLIYNR